MKTISWRQSQHRTARGSTTKGFRTAAGNRMVSMAERIPPLPLTSSRADQIFPTLTSVQIERVATHGRRRPVRSGETLVEQGDRAIPFFAVISGELEAKLLTCSTHFVFSTFRTPLLTAENNYLSGRRHVARYSTF